MTILITGVAGFIGHHLAQKLLSWRNDVVGIDNYITGQQETVAMPLEMLLTSSIGTRYVAQFATEKKSRILFTSSSEIYGDPQMFPQAENYWGNVDPVGLRSPYEEGKRYAESFLLSSAKKSTISVVI